MARNETFSLEKVLFFEIVSLNVIIWKCLSGKVKGFDQVIKGIWWMPWHMKAMKDVVSCDKPREGASNHQSGDFRMGEPLHRNG